jgi:hypothetical protein
MKNNLIKALVLSLDYEINTYSTRHFSYKAIESEDDTTVIITVKVSESGAFHGLQNIYALIHERLCSHATVENKNLVITIF